MAHPRIDELIAGEREARAHLDGCATCRRLVDLSRPPLTASPTSLCEKFLPLVARIDALDVQDARALERHLAMCGDCRELAETTRPRPADFETPPTVDPSVYVRGPEIGVGGMGRAVRAHDRRLGRDVVLKEADDPALWARFEMEARLAASLQHPATVSVHESGRWPDGKPFYAMELVHGRPLDVRIAEARSFHDRLALLPAVIAATEAIAYAHDQRIVHRDVKPQNIIVGDFGESVVIDWGLAKRLDDLRADDPPTGERPRRTADNLTIVGAGTPQYMPPEQARGEPPDEGVDVYALGATLYHLFTGRPPYGSGDSHATRESLLAGPPVSLESLPLLAIPAELKSIIAKAMSRDRAQRFRTAKGLATELKRFQTGRLVASHRYSRIDKTRHWWRQYRSRIRGRFAIAVGVALSIAGVLSLAQILYERGRAQKTAAALLLEQGRQELLAGSPTRALAYLDEAYRQGARGTALRYLVAAASRDVEAFELDFDGRGIEFSPDGSKVLGTMAGRVAEWDARTGNRLLLLDSADNASYSPGGERILAWTESQQSARLYASGSGDVLAAFPHGALLNSAHFTADAKRILTVGSWDGVMKLWSVDGTSAKSVTVPVASSSRRGGPTFDGRAIVVVGFGANEVEIRDSSTGILFGAVETPSRVLDADLSADGRRLVTAQSDRTALVWDLPSRRVLHTLPAHAGMVVVARFTPKGDRVVTMSEATEVHVWDASSGHLLARIDKRDRFGELRMSPDGTRIATVSQSGLAKLWSVADGALLATFEVPETPELLLGIGMTARFSPDGERLLVSAKGRSWIWNARSSRLRRRIEDASIGSLSPVGGSPEARTGDGKFAAFARGPDVEVIEIERGAVRERFRADSTLVHSIAFNDEGTLVATVGAEGKTRLWEWRSGTLLDEFTVSAPRPFLGPNDSHFTCCELASFVFVGFSDDDSMWTGTDRDRSVWNVSLDDRTPREIHIDSSFRFRYFTSRKAARAIGWRPQIPFTQTVADAAAELVRQGVLPPVGGS